MAKPIVIDPIAPLPGTPLVSASLGAPSGGASSITSVAARPPNGYYVIIGCGAAAVINHTTLRQSAEGRKRLGAENIGTDKETPGLPVLHVGFSDPWKDYYPHGMGQPPYLLRMPGYHAVPDFTANTIHTGLESRIFAKSTADERALLESRFRGRSFFVDGWVAAIEGHGKRFAGTEKTELITKWKAWKQDESYLNEAFDDEWKPEFPPYRLIIVRPWQMETGKLPIPILHVAYAHKIDICSGAGPMNVKPREGEVPLFNKADRPPWLAPEYWDAATRARTIVHGMDGLTHATAWPDDKRVVVYGAGGIGLNQVERARDVGCPLDWLATQGFEGTVNLYRNFNAFGDPKKLKPTPGDAMLDIEDTAALDAYKKAGAFLPALPQWRFAANAKIGKAEDGVPPRMTISANPKNKDLLMRDHFNKQGYPPDKAGVFPLSLGNLTYIKNPPADGAQYDRVVLCIGQDVAAPGEPSKITGPLGVPAFVNVDGFAVGIEWEGGNIRALGAAAAMFPSATLPGNKALEKANTDTDAFIESLPVSSVLPGFIRTGWTIAMANGYLGSKGRPNTNINTAPKSDLKTALEKAAIPASEAEKIAALIVNLRRSPANGIPSFATFKDWVDKRADQAMKKGATDDDSAAWLAATQWEKVTQAVSMDYPPPVPFPE